MNFKLPRKEVKAQAPFKIPEQIRPAYDTKLPAFSFKHFDVNHNRYSAACIKTIDSFRLLVKHLNTMCQITWREIKQAKQFHAHEVNWNATEEKNGFSHLPQRFRDFPAFQFKAFDAFRVFGFFNADSIFEVVWFDPGHLIYKAKR